MNEEPIFLVFQEDMLVERIAEFIQLLSEVYGEELHVTEVNDLYKGENFDG